LYLVLWSAHTLGWRLPNERRPWFRSRTKRWRAAHEWWVAHSSYSTLDLQASNRCELEESVGMCVDSAYRPYHKKAPNRLTRRQAVKNSVCSTRAVSDITDATTLIRRTNMRGCDMYRDLVPAAEIRHSVASTFSALFMLESGEFPVFQTCIRQ
jgi:hypothetical protein